MNVLGLELTAKNVLLIGGILGLALVAMVVHAQAVGWGIPPDSTQLCMFCH